MEEGGGVWPCRPHLNRSPLYRELRQLVANVLQVDMTDVKIHDNLPYIAAKITQVSAPEYYDNTLYYFNSISMFVRNP